MSRAHQTLKVKQCPVKIFRFFNCENLNAKAARAADCSVLAAAPSQDSGLSRHGVSAGVMHFLWNAASDGPTVGPSEVPARRRFSSTKGDSPRLYLP